MSRAGMGPLLVTWSPGRVSVLDPATRELREGVTLADCLGSSQSGREAVVAVSQRSAFVRTVPVPALSRDEIEKVLAFKLAPLLPLGPAETVHGFRLARGHGREAKGEGRTAVVGAIKTESLRKIHQEAAAAGLRLRAVVPLAFGSWLAANAKMLTDGAVVETSGAALNVDVVSGGELCYSRSVALPETPEEIEEEIATTFCIAKVEPGRVLSAASPEIRSDQFDPRRPVEYLADPRVIDRLLFSLELPEVRRSRQAKARNRTAQRALVAAIVAVLFGGFALSRRDAAETKASDAEAHQQVLLHRQTALEKKAEARSAQYEQAAKTLSVAFAPAQSFTDVLTVLGTAPASGLWLTGLTLERGKPLLIHGTSTDGHAAAKYVGDLSKSPRFRGMKLTFANHVTIGKKPVVQFGISGHVVGNLPVAALAPGAQP